MVEWCFYKRVAIILIAMEYSSWNTYSSSMIRNIIQNDAVCADLGKITNANIAKNNCARANINIVLYHRIVPIEIS